MRVSSFRCPLETLDRGRDGTLLGENCVCGIAISAAAAAGRLVLRAGSSGSGGGASEVLCLIRAGIAVLFATSATVMMGGARELLWDGDLDLAAPCDTCDAVPTPASGATG